MNVYEIGNLAQKLSTNTYPGRGIVLGISADGKTAIAAYFIMGRSVNSRNRVFIQEPDGIRTEAHDPSLMKDPHLIIYHPVREVGAGLIVTNGDQTDTIWEFLGKGESWEAALRTRMFEDDGPNWTPRISGLQAKNGSYKMSILKAADPEMRSSINQILRYPENSAGSIMTTEYVSLRPTMTVEEAILRIRRQGIDKETIYTCYVTDQQRKLLGLVTVKDLLLADDDEMTIEELMLTNLIFVSTHTDQEEVAHMFSKYNFLALPVVDTENRMVGIVTFDDAMDVMEEEATEDMELMSGITPSEKPYLKSSPWELFKNRFPWLTLLMVSSTFTGLIMTAFEDALAAQIALTAFIPMLMGTGGNSGSQSSVTVIRGLSLGELKFRDIGTVLWKELRTAVLAGLCLAAVCFVKIWLVDRMLFGNTDITLMVDLVVCSALALTVVIAKLVGGALPMIAKALGADPAVMASPFITTIVDAVSLLVYFLFANMLLGI